MTASPVTLGPALTAVPEPWLTADEAAALMRVSNATVVRGAKSGRLPAMKVGAQWRFLASQLVEACSRGVVVPAAVAAAAEREDEWLPDLSSVKQFAA